MAGRQGFAPRPQDLEACMPLITLTPRCLGTPPEVRSVGIGEHVSHCITKKLCDTQFFLVRAHRLPLLGFAVRKF